MTDAAPIQQVFGDLAKTFVDAAEEIVRARAKHGPQKHLPLINRWVGVAAYARMEQDYKDACAEALQNDESSWDFILLEEVYEALAAIASGNLLEGRAELIQVLAMAASIVEIVDEQIAITGIHEARAEAQAFVSNALESEWVDWDIDANQPAAQ